MSPNLNVLQNYRKDLHYSDKPFPHVIIQDALPNELYLKLLSKHPEKQLLDNKYQRPSNAWRISLYEMGEEFKMDDIWKRFMEYHTSDAFYKQLIDIFRDDILKHYSRDVAKEILIATPQTRTKKNRKHIVTDCQLVLNKPSDKTSRTPHVDNPKEIYAGLFYLRHLNDKSTGGDLVLYTPKDSYRKSNIQHKGARQLDLSHITPTKTVSYRGNTYVVFLNIRESPHGVTIRQNADLNRLSVNIIAEHSQPLWSLKAPS